MCIVSHADHVVGQNLVCQRERGGQHGGQSCLGDSKPGPGWAGGAQAMLLPPLGPLCLGDRGSYLPL